MGDSGDEDVSTECPTDLSEQGLSGSAHLDAQCPTLRESGDEHVSTEYPADLSEENLSRSSGLDAQCATLAARPQVVPVSKLDAKRCSVCGKRMGYIRGMRGFGLHERAHEARCRMRKMRREAVSIPAFLGLGETSARPAMVCS